MTSGYILRKFQNFAKFAWYSLVLYFFNIISMSVQILSNVFVDGLQNDSQDNDVTDFVHVPSYDTDEEDYSDYPNDGTTSETG